MSKIFNTQEKVKEVIDGYESGLSTYNLGEKYNCGHTTIWNLLINNNVPRRSTSNGKRRLYFFNQKFFDIIDNEAKAYFLGFLFADGYVHSNMRQIDLGLNPRDKHILENFANHINYPIEKIGTRKKFDKRTNKYYSSSTIKLCSKHIAQSLVKHGCVPRKSLILKFPSTIPNYLIHHFCRGYFDGNGCVHINKNRRFIIQIAGTLDFLSGFGKKSQELGNAIHTNIYKNKNIHNLVYGRKPDTSSLRNWFYNDATFYLQRKYERFFNSQLGG